MGATTRAQARSDAAIVTGNSVMTCPDAYYQAPRSRVPSVVVLGVEGSNPFAHPMRSSRFRGGLVHVWALVIFAAGSDILPVFLSMVG